MSFMFRYRLHVLTLRVLVLLVALSVLNLCIGLIGSTTRVLFIFTAVFAMFTAVLFLHRFVRGRPRILVPMLLVLLLLAVLPARMLTDSRGIDRDSLRASYIQRLHSYLGTRYSWGGESRLGIDCSGLARTALIEAMLAQGVKAGNARAVWPVAWRLWWRDTSADGMLHETYGYTHRVGHAGKLSRSESIVMNAGESLQPGDLAVTDSGVHVMVYAGNGRWIEANPDDWRVVENRAARSRRAYFNMPVTILRWWVF